MRQMRLFKREVKDAEALRQIIDACEVVRIGTVDEEGMFIVPVNFGYEFETDGEEKPKLRLYFHGAKEGRKADAFAQNPGVAIEMDGSHQVIQGDYACSYSFSYQSIMGNGTVRLLTEKEEILHGLAPDAGIVFRDDMLSGTNVYCIDVTSFTGKERAPKN